MYMKHRGIAVRKLEQQLNQKETSCKDDNQISQSTEKKKHTFPGD